MAKQAKKSESVDFERGRGKRDHQKMKPFLVLEYLMRETDEQHPAKIDDIVFYLSEHGIEAENRSVKSDIDEINYALYMLEQDCHILEAVEDLKSEDYASEKFIFPTDNHRGYYVSRRRNDVTEDDMRLLAEAAYSAKFLNKERAESLVKAASSLVSRHSAQRIIHEVPALERPRTTSKTISSNLVTINEAMRPGTRHAPHIPEKITFRYQTHRIDNVEKTVDKRKGELYRVSPYRLIVCDGNFYLLAFDDKSQDMRTYRVDRMKDVNPTGEARDGEENFAAIDMRNYTIRVFGMFGGERVTVNLLFDNTLLDTVIDRFGTSSVIYTKADEEHFTVSADVELSEQFYAWLCGFGSKVKIIAPETVIAEYKQHLKKILSIY